MIKKIIPSLITYLFNIFCCTNRKLDREITQNPQILVYKLQSIKKNFTYLHNLIFYSPDSRSQLNWPSTTVLLFKQKTSEDDATTLPPSRPSQQLIRGRDYCISGSLSAILCNTAFLAASAPRTTDVRSESSTWSTPPPPPVFLRPQLRPQLSSRGMISLFHCEK